MVNMNVAEDKDNQQLKINGVNQEVLPSNSTTSAEASERKAPKTIVNGNFHPNNDSNKLSFTNGTLPKLNSVSCTLLSDVPTTSRQALCGESTNLLNANADRGESAQGLLPKNNSDCQEYENRCEDLKKQFKPRDQSCKYDSSSSSEDEECCIYTYKGDSSQMADLPSSFFKLDFMPSRQQPNSRNSSPDMDYLEMDFDPGPSNDRDSISSGSEFDVERPEEEELFPAEVFSLPRPQTSSGPAPELFEPELNSPTPVSPLSIPSPVRTFNSRPQSSPVRSNWSSMVPNTHRVIGSPLSPKKRLKTPEAKSESLRSSNCSCASNSQSCVVIDENFNDGDSGIMIWKEQEAREKQATKIGTSACGATAVINTLLALKVPYTVSKVRECVNTRLRLESAPVPEYLFSRSNAGATHTDVIQGLHSASRDLVFAKFFHMYPQRNIALTRWLTYWIKKGAVPIVTLNPQRDTSADRVMADCWRHQMVYGVSARGIHLTDPLDVQSEAQLRTQLCSPPELRVAREDVLSRWNPDTNLRTLTDPTLPLWRKYNVLGQVVNMVREERSDNTSRTHVTIPAAYSSGVILAMLQTNRACEELRLAPEFPLGPFDPRGTFHDKLQELLACSFHML